MRRVPHYIGGREVQGSEGAELPVYNPASGEKTGIVIAATAEQVFQRDHEPVGGDLLVDAPAAGAARTR